MPQRCPLWPALAAAQRYATLALRLGGPVTRPERDSRFPAGETSAEIARLVYVVAARSPGHVTVQTSGAGDVISPSFTEERRGTKAPSREGGRGGRVCSQNMKYEGGVGLDSCDGDLSVQMLRHLKQCD